MKNKNPNPVFCLPDSPSNSLIEVYFAVNHLKQIYRQGWLSSNIPPENCESVAEHCFGVAFLGMVITDLYFPELDKLKLLQMALIHDLGEVFVGDITPNDGISELEKHKREKDAFTLLFRNAVMGETYLSLWEEYEIGESQEAKFIRQIDRLEMAFQAKIYEYLLEIQLPDFFSSTRKELTNSTLIKIFNELVFLHE